MKKYGMKVLLYHATKTITFQYDFADYVTTLLFPIEDIWSTYATKQIKYSNRDQWVQYEPELLIQNHGTGLKLFLLKEVLQHNHNAIFFDLDMGFLYDPIPFLWQGFIKTPDVITSLEVIRCKAEPNNPTAADAATTTVNGRAPYMPNSGTLMIRSTIAGQAFLTEWMNATIEGNWYNEQYSFTWPKGYELQPSESCNQLPNGIISGTQTSYTSYLAASTSTTKESKKSIQFCFLNKYLFQTGMILFGCRYQSYYSNLSLAGIRGQAVDPTDSTPSPTSAYFPVNAHVNGRTPKSFKAKKTTILKDLNLWLYDPSPSSSLSSNVKLPSAEPLSASSLPPSKPALQLQCKPLEVSKTRWVTKRYNPVWHSIGYFPEDQT